MNKKRNRKGFTIVELSIVIAVIAILAAVMIPTFSNIISKSKKAAAENNAKAIYTNYVNALVNPESGDPSEYESECYVHVDGYYVHIVNGGVKTADTKDSEPTSCYRLLDVENNEVDWVTKTGCTAGDGCLNKNAH